MSLPLEREDIQQVTEELEFIIAAHLAWFKQVNRALVCGSPPGDADLLPDAHLRSPFGQWYYTGEPHLLAENAVHEELGAIQQAMHAATRMALQEVAEGRRPSPDLYDQCMDLSLRLNTRLRNLQLEIIGELLSTDPLTGCASRRGMLNRLREEQERAQRIQRPYQALFRAGMGFQEGGGMPAGHGGCNAPRAPPQRAAEARLFFEETSPLPKGCARPSQEQAVRATGAKGEGSGRIWGPWLPKAFWCPA